MSRTAECRALNDGGLPAAATRLSIHGLWAQPESRAYCDVPAALVELDQEGRWSKLPPVDLDARGRARLRVAMPGIASALDRHEWLKHGSCHRGPDGADGYFDDMLSLADAINASPVASLLADRVGAKVRASDIRAAFDAAFGAGTGARVQVRCADDGRRTLIHELTISLRGEIAPRASLRALMLAAGPVAPGCREGVIDPAGLQ